MGTVPSVRVKVAGKSKEVNPRIEGIVNTLIKFMYVSIYVNQSHLIAWGFVFCDDVSQRIDVMFICGEWGSSKGGLPAFNREFAVNLAKATSDQTRPTFTAISVFIMGEWRDKGGLERRTW